MTSAASPAAALVPQVAFRVVVFAATQDAEKALVTAFQCQTPGHIDIRRKGCH